MEPEIKVAEHERDKDGKGLGTFEKFLFVWVAICIVIGSKPPPITYDRASVIVFHASSDDVPEFSSEPVLTLT